MILHQFLINESESYYINFLASVNVGLVRNGKWQLDVGYMWRLWSAECKDTKIHCIIATTQQKNKEDLRVHLRAFPIRGFLPSSAQVVWPNYRNGWEMRRATPPDLSVVAKQTRLFMFAVASRQPESKLQTYLYFPNSIVVCFLISLVINLQLAIYHCDMWYSGTFYCEIVSFLIKWSFKITITQK